MDFNTVVSALLTMLGVGGVTVLSLKTLARKILHDISSAKDAYKELFEDTQKKINACEKLVNNFKEKLVDIESSSEKILKALKFLLANQIYDNLEWLEKNIDAFENKSVKLLYKRTLMLYAAYSENGWAGSVKNKWEEVNLYLEESYPDFKKGL